MKRKINFVNKFRTQNKRVFIAQTLEPLIKIGRMYVHERVAKNSNFMSELEDFPNNAHDDCIDAVSESISHLPEPAVDVSRIPSIQSTLQSTGGVAKISRLD